MQVRRPIVALLLIVAAAATGCGDDPARPRSPASTPGATLASGLAPNQIYVCQGPDGSISINCDGGRKAGTTVVDLPEKTYVCEDSAGAREVSETPITRCDSEQQVWIARERKVDTIPPTITDAEREPFTRLHPKLRVSPLRCPSEDVTHCDDMVRLSCDAGSDNFIFYYDNQTAEQLGRCGIWVKNPRCMPDRWRACAIKNGTRHVFEEPNPSIPVQ
jgi:hypothetical protein